MLSGVISSLASQPLQSWADNTLYLFLNTQSASAEPIAKATTNTSLSLQADNTITVLMVCTVLLALMALIALRLYATNREKAKRLLQKATQLEAEVKTNAELTEVLQNIFDSSMDGILVFTSVRDSNNKIVDFKYKLFNKIALQMLNMDASSLLNSHLLEVFPGNKEAGLFDAYATTVETGTPFETIIHYNTDKLDAWFSINAVKNRDGFIVTFADISEFKQSEQLLLAKQHELQETNNELEQFVYVASHDLKEPLRKIRAFGDRLQAKYNDALDDKARSYIEKMQAASDRMQILIDDLLKFSRAAQGDTQMQSVDLNHVLLSVQDVLSESMQETQTVIKTEQLPLINANRSQIEQLFQNIIANAIKYTKPDHPPLIEIASTVVKRQIDDEDQAFWQLTFKDYGIGFENEYKDKIFEIFQRLHGRSSYSGTGIGLAICMKIVSNHHGYIFAHSEINKGATFTIQLPKYEDRNLSKG